MLESVKVRAKFAPAALLFLSWAALAGNAPDWLRAQQAADGSIASANSVAAARRASFEAVIALADSAVFQRARGVFPIDADSGPDLLARQLRLRKAFGEDSAPVAAQLLALQNGDGGFGPWADFQSTPLDTALALRSLAISPTAPGVDSAAEAALGYLQDQQRDDGSWSVDDEHGGSIHLTALAILGLKPWRLTRPLENRIGPAVDFLLAHADASGHWGPHWLTALVLQALGPEQASRFVVEQARNALDSAQAADGAWDSDVFTTALALQTRNLFAAGLNAPDAVGITGVVIDGGSNLPLSGISVSVPGMATQTDLNGRFNLLNLVPGAYTLTVSASGYQDLTRGVNFPGATLLDAGALSLRVAADRGVLLGRVTEAANTAALADATVAVAGVGEVQTDADGTYRLVLPPGDFNVSAAANRFATANATGHLPAGASAVFSPALLAAGQTPPDPGVRISGRVVDGVTHAALVGAAIQANSVAKTTTSDAAGRFVLGDLDAGAITLTLTAGGHDPVQLHLTAQHGAQADLGDIALPPKQVPPTSTLTGHVSDTISGAAISGAEIALPALSLSTVSQSDGRFFLDNIDSADFVVEINADGFHAEQKHIQLAQAGSVQLQVKLRANGASNVHFSQLAPAQSDYTANSRVKVSGTLLNETDTPKRTTLLIAVSDPTGNLVDQFPATRVPLGADPESAVITVPAHGGSNIDFSWNTGAHKPGDYSLIARAFDADNGIALASGAVEITVLPTNRIGGGGFFDPPITQLAAQTSIKVQAIVQNFGNQNLAPSEITADIHLQNKGFDPRLLLTLNTLIESGAIVDANKVTATHGGDLIVAGGNTLYRVGADGTVRIFAADVGVISDISQGPIGNGSPADAGRLYVLLQSGTLKVFSGDGALIKSLATGLGDAIALDVFPNGDALVGLGMEIHRVSLAGDDTVLLQNGFAEGEGVTVDSNGRIFVADRQSGRILQFADGRLSTFAQGLQQPFGLAVDTGDQLYAVDFAQNSLLRFNDQGVATIVATDLGGPVGLILDKQNNSYVSGRTAGKVFRITPEGAVTTLAYSPIKKPGVGLRDTNGDLLVANVVRSHNGQESPGAAFRFPRQDLASPLTGATTDVAALLLDTDGTLLAAHSDRIDRVFADGSTEKIAGSFPRVTAMAVAPDGDGLIVVAPRRNTSHRVALHRIAADGTTSVYAQDYWNNPVGLALAADGSPMLADAGNKLIRISSAREVQTSQFAGSFWNAAGSSADGTVYVGGGNRIIRITPQDEVSELPQLSFLVGAIAVSADGIVYVASGKKIYRVDNTGETLVHTINNIVFKYLEVDSNNNIWASSNRSSSLTRIAPDGTTVTFPLPNVQGVAGDGMGGAYAGVFEAVVHIDADGQSHDLVRGGDLQQSFVTYIKNDGRGHLWFLNDKRELFQLDLATGVLVESFPPLGAMRALVSRPGNDVLVLNEQGSLLRIGRPNSLPEMVVVGDYASMSLEGSGNLLLGGRNSIERLDFAAGSMTTLATGFRQVGFVLGEADGSITVGDQATNRISHLDGTGVELSHFDGLSFPQALVFDRDERLLVSGSDPAALLELTDAGRTRVAIGEVETAYATRDANGDILFARGSSLGRIGSNGQVQFEFGFPAFRGLTTTPDGNLVMVGNSALIQRTGVATFSILAAGVNSLSDTRVTADGTVVYTDSTSGTLNRQNGDGTVTLLAQNLVAANSLAEASKQRLLVAYGRAQLAELSADGQRRELPFADALGSILDLDVDAGDRVNILAADRSVRRADLNPPTPIEVGKRVFSQTLPLPVLVTGGAPLTLDFGEFTPSVSGDYQLTLSDSDSTTTVPANATLHVGASALATFNPAQSDLGPGDQTVSAQLLVLGIDTTAITRIEPNAITQIAESKANGRGIAADSHGQIYASAASKIVRIDKDGRITDFVSGVSPGTGLAVDSADNIYFASFAKILRVDQHSVLSTAAEFPGERVVAVTASSKGEIYAATGNHVYKLGSQGTKLLATVAGISKGNLAVDGFGEIYMLTTDNIIWRISADGSQISPYFTDPSLGFEFEGANLVADCANNLLFAPSRLLPLMPGGEENTILQLVGDTGDVQKVLFGPDVHPDLGDIDVLYFDRTNNRLMIWTDRSGGTIFSFPVSCGGLDLSVHLIGRADATLAPVDPAPTSIRSTADGVREYTWALEGVDQRGRGIDLNLNFESLKLNETRPALSDAFIEYNNSFVPGQSVRVPIDIPSVTARFPVTLALATDKTVYAPGETARINLNLSNRAGTQLDGLLHIAILDGNDDTVSALPNIPVIALAQGATATFPTQWDDTGVLAGDYRIHARLTDADGRELALADTVLSVATQADGPALTATVAADRSVYSPFDSVTLTARLSNHAVNAVQPASRGEFTVIAPNGAILHSATRDIGQIAVVSSRRAYDGLRLDRAMDGLYQVRFEDHDPTTGAMLAESQTRFSVQADPAQTLHGTVTVDAHSIIQGNADRCAENIDNLAADPIMQLDVHYVLADSAGPVLQNVQKSVDILPSGQAAHSTPIPDTLPVGSYLCLLRATVNGKLTTLAGTDFTVLAQQTVPPTALSLGNRVFDDADNNGILNAGEAGIDGVTVVLFADGNHDGQPDGAAVATTATANGGYYRFDNLSQGAYVVQIPALNFAAGAVLAGSSIAPLTEPDPNSDGDGNNNLIPIADPTAKGTLTATVDLAPGTEPINEADVGQPGGGTDADSNLTLDLGLHTAAASPPISGTVSGAIWDDTDGDGAHDATEPGLPGVLVHLDGVGITSDVHSDAAGRFQYTQLPAGDYRVSVDADDPALGGRRLSSAANPIAFVIEAGQQSLDVGFGFQAAAAMPAARQIPVGGPLWRLLLLLGLLAMALRLGPSPKGRPPKPSPFGKGRSKGISNPNNPLREASDE